MQERITMVVPLFNEAGRWDTGYWRSMMGIPSTHWLFVDDGSTDNTNSIVTTFAKSDGAQLLTLAGNRGKGNAVRLGLLKALESPGLGVGFMDGDGAFHPDDVQAVLTTLLANGNANGRQEALESVWGARVALAGREINRRTSRHYVGRIIATAISQGLPGVPYDTQCGLKVFSPSSALHECLAQAFATDWFFDVEILQRWIRITGKPMRIWEQPLMHWRDVPGSKISLTSSVQVAREVTFITRGNARLQ